MDFLCSRSEEHRDSFVRCKGYCWQLICPHCYPEGICSSCRRGWDEREKFVHTPEPKDPGPIDVPKRHSKVKRKLQFPDEGGKQRVARKVRNARRQPPNRYLAFVSGLDDASPLHGPLRWFLTLECVREDWFYRTMYQLVPHGLPNLVAAFPFPVPDFSDVFFKLSLSQRRLFYDLHRRFVALTLDGADPAPTAIVTAWIRPNDAERAIVRGAHWYIVTLDDPEPHDDDVDEDDIGDHRAVFQALALDFEDDPAPVRRRLRFVDYLPLLDGVAKALHLPQWQPADDDSVTESDDETMQGSPPGSDTDSEERHFSTTTRGDSAFARVVDSLVGRVKGFFAGFPWLDGGPQPAFAAAGVGGVDFHHEPAARPDPMRYHAAPTAGGLQMANPMLPGGPLPTFVAVMNIGQGNCNALVDANGRIVAYYDLGFPLPVKHATAPILQYAPCFHADPLIILSHWDWDHWSMGRRARDSWNARWIAPQQHIGSAATQQVYGRVVHSVRGGAMHIWAADPNGAAVPRHLRLPYGFIERGIVGNQLGATAANLNDGGLALYVCVRSPGPAGGGLPVAAQPVAARVGVVPPASRADAAAVAAVALCAGQQFSARVAAVADESIREVARFAGLGGGAPTQAHTVLSAIAAVGGVLARGGGNWQAALDAMRAGAGAVANAANTLYGPLTGAGGVTAAAAVAAAGGGYAGAVGSACAKARAVVIADAAAAAFGGGFAVAVPAAATASAQAVANHVAGGVIMGAPVAPPNPAVAAAVNAHALDAELEQIAAAGAAGGAQARAAGGGGAPTLPSADIVTAALGSIARVLARDGGGAWRDAIRAMSWAAGGGAPVNTVHGAAAYLGGIAAVMVGGAATAALRVAAQGVAIAAGAGPLGNAHLQREKLATAVAIADAAVAAAASVTAVAGVPAAGAPAQGRARAAEAGSPIVAHGNPAANAALQAASSMGRPLQAREVSAAGHEAARQMGIALGVAVAHLPAVGAPLPPPAGAAPIPGVLAGPGAGPIAAPGMGGAIALVGRQAGPGPTAANERFILLTGDVGFSHVPSQQAAAAGWPRLVGITPSHHGANSCFTAVGSSTYIPYAPGSPAAAAGAAAHEARHVHGANQRRQADVAAAAYMAALVADRFDVGPLNNALTPVVAAAANNAVAGANVMARLGALQGAAAGPAIIAAARVFALGVGANAVALAGQSNCAVVAVAAAQRLHVAVGGGVNVANMVQCGTSAIAIGVGGGAAAAVPLTVAHAVAALGLPGGVGIIAAANLAAVTPAELARAAAVVTFVAALVDAIAAAPAGPVPTVAGNTTSAAHAAAVAVVAQVTGAAVGLVPGGALPASPVYWRHAGPPARRTHAAAAVAVALYSGALAAAHQNRSRAAVNAVHALARGQSIAYSYGVRNVNGAWRHSYGAVNFRHPVPDAVEEYAGRGWTERVNTSVNAWRSVQPDPAPAPAAFVSGGHVAIGWEVGLGYEGALRGDVPPLRVLRRSGCALCGTYHFSVAER